MTEISAGAIVYTLINDEPHYLLIENYDGDWGFPKGHLEENETPLKAAEREIQEEVCLEVKIDDSFLRTLEYVLPDGSNKIVYYYLAAYENQTVKKQESEVKDTKLLPYAEALTALTYENMKAILKEAHKRIYHE